MSFENEPTNAAWSERYFHIREPDGYQLSFAKSIDDREVKSINSTITDLAKEVEDIKPGKKEEDELDYVKQTNTQAKTASLIQKVLNVLPQTIEVATTFTPLSPFSKVIGKGIQDIVDAISKRKRK
jgi:hypothetical protein